MRKLGPLMDPTIIDGGRVTLRGNVTGPSDANVVEKLAGAAGIVILESGSIIQKTQVAALPPSSAPAEILWRVKPATHDPFTFELVTAAGLLPGEVDNGWAFGINALGADASIPGAGLVIEDSFNGNYETYFQYHVAGFGLSARPWAYNYNKTTGANTLELGSQIVSVGYAAGSGGPGNDTFVINSFASNHQRWHSDGTLIDVATLASATIAIFDMGTALAIYAFRGNQANQEIAIQANSNGALLIDTVRLAFFAGTPAGKQIVTGSKAENPALTSLMTALGPSGYNLVTDSTS